MRNQHCAVGGKRHPRQYNPFFNLHIHTRTLCLIAPRFPASIRICMVVEHRRPKVHLRWLNSLSQLRPNCIFILARNHSSRNITLILSKSTFESIEFKPPTRKEWKTQFKSTFRFPGKFTGYRNIFGWLFNTTICPENYNFRHKKWVIKLNFTCTLPQNNDLNSMLLMMFLNQIRSYRCKSTVIWFVVFGIRTTNIQIATIAVRSTKKTDSWGLIEVAHKQPSLNSTIGLALRFHAFRTQAKRTLYPYGCASVKASDERMCSTESSRA